MASKADFISLAAAADRLPAIISGFLQHDDDYYGVVRLSRVEGGHN